MGHGGVHDDLEVDGGGGERGEGLVEVGETDGPTDDRSRSPRQPVDLDVHGPPTRSCVNAGSASRRRRDGPRESAAKCSVRGEVGAALAADSWVMVVTTSSPRRRVGHPEPRPISLNDPRAARRIGPRGRPGRGRRRRRRRTGTGRASPVAASVASAGQNCTIQAGRVPAVRLGPLRCTVHDVKTATLPGEGHGDHGVGHGLGDRAQVAGRDVLDRARRWLPVAIHRQPGLERDVVERHEAREELTGDERVATVLVPGRLGLGVGRLGDPPRGWKPWEWTAPGRGPGRRGTGGRCPLPLANGRSTGSSSTWPASRVTCSARWPWTTSPSPVSTRPRSGRTSPCTDRCLPTPRRIWRRRSDGPTGAAGAS